MAGEKALEFDSEHRLRSENLPFDIDVWFPMFQNFTAASFFLPLSVDEAKAIQEFHDVSWRHTSPTLKSTTISTLEKLEKELDKHVADFGGDHGVFVRLCGRSPKDGEPLERVKFWEEYTNALYRVMTEKGLPHAEYDAVNAKLKLEAIGRVSWLRVNNGREAMSLLLTSERVYSDMLDWLRYGEPEQICLRRWEGELIMENEFRCFVCKGVLTGISQYDHYAFYPALHQIKDTLCERIRSYWREVHSACCDADSSYVIDIGYLPISDRFTVIELSPFSPCTGAALFSWSRDLSLLEDTSGRQFEFRLKREEDLHPQLDDLVQVNWDDRWRQPHAPYWDLYERSRAGEAAPGDARGDVEEDDGDERERERERERGVSIFSFVGNFISTLWYGSISEFPQPMIDSSNPDTASLASPPPPAPVPAPTEVTASLFVYGTLKSGFQWNSKYLSPRFGARLRGHCSSADAFPLVVGDCGVPYLLHLPGHGHRVVGELWEVPVGLLSGLDDYEGVSKHYYARKTIAVRLDGPWGTEGLTEGRGLDVFDAGSEASDEMHKEVQAEVYCLVEWVEELVQREHVAEYTLDMHRRQYRPIRHIQRKQLAYFGAPSGWGKTSQRVDGSAEAPTH